MIWGLSLFIFFFFFNDPATTEIYTLSLHDALPIYVRRLRLRRAGDAAAGAAATRGRARSRRARRRPPVRAPPRVAVGDARVRDRKSTRLNSSHLVISYAVFCLKKKKNNLYPTYSLALLYHTHFNGVMYRSDDRDCVPSCLHALGGVALNGVHRRLAPPAPFCGV